MGFPIQVRWHLYIKSGPWYQCGASCWAPQIKITGILSPVYIHMPWFMATEFPGWSMHPITWQTLTWWRARLLHSPSPVAIGLPVGYETRPPIDWHHAFVIGWSKYKLGLPSAPLHYGLTWPVGIPTVFQTSVTVPLHCPNGRQLPAVRAVQGDCERV